MSPAPSLCESSRVGLECDPFNCCPNGGSQMTCGATPIAHMCSLMQKCLA